MVAMVLVVVQAALALLFFQPTSGVNLALTILSSAAYTIFYWRRRSWSRWVVIFISLSSFILVWIHIRKHETFQQRGDFWHVPIAVTLLVLLFLPDVRRQFHSKPLW